MRKIFALGAMIGVMAFSPSASATARPPENPVCRPLARTIEHWLPTLGNRADDAKAAVAVLDYIPAGRWLDRWITEVGLSFHAEGLGWDYRPEMRQGLTRISRLCPSLPASGPLP